MAVSPKAIGQQPGSGDRKATDRPTCCDAHLTHFDLTHSDLTHSDLTHPDLTHSDLDQLATYVVFYTAPYR